MKTVFDSKELPHIYVHQNAPMGRCSASMSFDRDSFYSYAAKIGLRIKRKGRTAYLLDVSSYSNTTSRHQDELRSAIPSGETVFRTFSTNLDDLTGAVLLKESLKLAAECAIKAQNARTAQAWHRSQQARWLEQAAAVKAFYGLKAALPDISAVVEQLKRAEAAEAKREAAAQAKREREAEASIRLWLAGEPVSIPSGISKVYLRSRHAACESMNGNEPDAMILETSKGVRVPLSDAERAFRFAMQVRNRTKCPKCDRVGKNTTCPDCIVRTEEIGWHRNGETFAVGTYQLDEITPEFIKAGCHKIEFSEVLRFAKAQGWTA